MKNRIHIAIAAVAMFLLAGAVPALAVPQLQLYIDGGTYNASTQTWETQSRQFWLGAYLNPDASTPVSGTYYVTTAFLGMPTPFSFDGTPVGYTDLHYGTPPVEGTSLFQPKDPGDLPSHGIYPAWFYQYAFTFDPTKTVPLQDLVPGTTPSATKSMFQRLFWVDLAGLYGDTEVHFDLFNTAMLGSDVDIVAKAPFSHDAQQVPEPGTLVLFGTGLVGIAVYGRKRFTA